MGGIWTVASFLDVSKTGEIKSEEKPSRKGKQRKGKARKWNEEQTDLLIDVLKQNDCLGDAFSKEYHLKGKRDKS